MHPGERVRIITETARAVLDGRLDPTGRRLLAQLADYRPWEARKI